MDDTIILRDVRDSFKLKVINQDSSGDGILSVVFSPDSKVIAAGDIFHYVKLWDFETGISNHLVDHTDSVRSVAFSPDGSRLASASYDNTVKIWNVASKECVNTLTGHKRWVFSVDFSPDGEQVVSADANGVIKIWNSEKVVK